MIVSNIAGGLGNQMFQYACGRAISLRSGQELRLIADRAPGYGFHNGFELKKIFGLNFLEAGSTELNDLLGWRGAPILRRIFSKSQMRWCRGRNWFAEPHYHYWPKIMQVGSNAYLHGYWQSELYFEEITNQLRLDFCFTAPFSEEDLNVVHRMRLQPSASIHVRRGDYTHAKAQGVMNICELDYYRDAINMLSAKVPHIKFFAFSDDPLWVQTELAKVSGSLEIVRHNTGLRSAYDMRLMSCADHHIIANSSFSWWGAWLNASPDKTVIAPKKWFLNGFNDRDLIPKSWIRL
jgi:Glycosyl transferase family 11